MLFHSRVSFILMHLLSKVNLENASHFTREKLFRSFLFTNFISSYKKNLNYLSYYHVPRETQVRFFFYIIYFYIITIFSRSAIASRIII